MEEEQVEARNRRMRHLLQDRSLVIFNGDP